MSNSPPCSSVTLSPEAAVAGALANYYGLDSYCEIVRFAKEEPSAISSNGEFRRKFNALYRVRRNESWQDDYYATFQKVALEHRVDFSWILSTLYDQTGRVETSFASKMLATIDTCFPIWDANVVHLLNARCHLGMPVPSHFSDDSKRMEKAVQSYEGLREFYARFGDEPECEEFIQYFDLLLPDYSHLSSAKKIDCLLWGAGSRRLVGERKG